jgi:hypothetical protein
MQPRIIVLSGPSHSTKVDVLDGLVLHLEERYGRGIRLQPDALDSSVVLETTHVRVGIIRAGHDPRQAEVDHVGDMIRRKCSLILYPESEQHATKGHLYALAEINGYLVAYWRPMRVAQVSDLMTYRYTQAQERGWAIGHNVHALIALVEQLLHEA